MKRIERDFIDKAEKVVDFISADSTGNVIIFLVLLGLLFQVIR